MTFGIFRSAPPAAPAVSVQEAYDLLASDAATLVDVRETFEWDQAHVDGALLIPLGELEARIAELPQGKPLLMFCRSGNRSGHAAEVLAAAGIKDVRNVQGGILAWARAGLPLKMG